MKIDTVSQQPHSKMYVSCCCDMALVACINPCLCCKVRTMIANMSCPHKTLEKLFPRLLRVSQNPTLALSFWIHAKYIKISAMRAICYVTFQNYLKLVLYLTVQVLVSQWPSPSVTVVFLLSRGLPFPLATQASDSTVMAAARAINTVCLVSFLAGCIKHWTAGADYSRDPFPYTCWVGETQVKRWDSGSSSMRATGFECFHVT